jgi:hypothetical protein
VSIASTTEMPTAWTKNSVTAASARSRRSVPMRRQSSPATTAAEPAWRNRQVAASTSRPVDIVMLTAHEP